MDLQLRGKTAIVTGSSSGIGRGIAIALAAEGVKIAVVARRQKLLEELADEIAAAKHQRPAIINAEIMDADSAQRISSEAIKALGQVDILINCAGGSRALPVDATEDRWEEAITLNFTRQRQLAHAVLPGMMERKWGRIINVSGASEPRQLNAANAAKGAIHVWAKGLSRNVGPYGVTVNSIAPGRIESDQIKRNFSPEERERYCREEIPVGKFGEPSDIGAVATFLASPVAHYITGVVLAVDGGLRKYAF